MRTVLSNYADVPPEAWRFVTNEYGRPEIDEPADARWLKFNLSHTSGLIELIVARDREVGSTSKTASEEAACSPWPIDTSHRRKWKRSERSPRENSSIGSSYTGR